MLSNNKDASIIGDKKPCGPWFSGNTGMPVGCDGIYGQECGGNCVIADRKAQMAKIFEDLWSAKKEVDAAEKPRPLPRKARRKTAPSVAPVCTRTEPIKLRSRKVSGTGSSDSGLDRSAH